MTEAPKSLATAVAGVPLRVPVMNAPGMAETARELERLVAGEPGALCLHPVTVQPFVHPEFRTLRNPGHDKVLPLVRQLRELTSAPIVACVAGGAPEEYGFLARVFGEAGAALIQLHLTDPWVEQALAPFDDLTILASVCAAVTAQSPVPVLVEVPKTAGDRYADVGMILREHHIGGAVVTADFAGLERFVLHAGGGTLDVVASGNVETGFAVAQLRRKGACAVQIGHPVRHEGPKVFGRLARELARELAR